MIKTILKNGALNMLGKVTFALSNIIFTSIVVKKLGINFLGIWETIYAFTLVVLTFNVSLMNTFLWKFSSTKVNRKRWLQVASFIFLSQMVIVLVIFLFFRKQISELIGLNIEYESILTLAVLISLISSQVDVFSTYLSSQNYSGFVSVAIGVSNLISLIFLILLLYFESDFFYLLYCFLLQKLIFVILILLKCSSKISLKSVLPSIPSIIEFNEVKYYFLNMALGALVILFQGNLVKIVVSKIGGAFLQEIIPLLPN